MIEDIIEERKKKLAEYSKTAGAYPARVSRDMVISDAISKFDELSETKKQISLVGRVTALRDQGKILFCDLKDESGKIQVVVNEAEIKDFGLIQSTLDIGDFFEVSGSLFATKRGEKSILPTSARIVGKSIRPLPSEWYGLEDTEIRLRKRYLDMLTHPEIRDLFIKKDIFWTTIRNFLKTEGFREVETAVLEPVPGGAEAEPFVTHHNALDTNFYLRISLELPLKRLLVGGYEKVFEIGRIFRNEGIDREHLQDYTQMECYWAYADYNNMMDLTRKMYQEAVKNVTGGYVTTYQDMEIDWSGEWPMVDYYEVFKKETGLDLKTTTIEELQRKAEEVRARIEPNMGRGRLIDLVYKKAVRPLLLQPCFLVNPPVDIEPLAKRSEEDSGRVERFQIMAGGTELGKGFSELNDPLDQRARFEEQMKLREAGDSEAQRIDDDFLEALEYGMPPAAGFGLSERLFSVIMNRPIRETVIFPLMRQE
ncbi:MAG: lysyl-tRNA synthetase, class II [Parcubacteria group bacterium LiPW_41]|nr:MAG: lysyl-tRNA synthetase, class II [Parcubacteria group bacterium LiPW_41]